MDIVLGISVTNRSVFAALVENRAEGPVIVRTMSRPRSSSDSAASQPHEVFESLATDPIENTDPSVHFTMTPDEGSSLFLASDFADADAGMPAAGGDAHDILMRSPTVEIEIKEVIAECAEAGFPDVPIVLCINSTDLGEKEIDLSARKEKTEEDGKKSDRPARRLFGRKKASGSERDRMIEVMSGEVEGGFDVDQTFFLPMVPSEDGSRRVLGVYTKASEPIIPTLKRFVEHGRDIPPFMTVETEYSLLLGLARLHVPDDEDDPKRRLVLRMGAEDSLALYLDGHKLRHFETLRSITIFDPPETIESRILLLRDEYGLGEADEILVLGESRENELVATLGEFFPESRVRSLRSVMPAYEDEFELDMSREASLASSVALRGLLDPSGVMMFEPVDLIPKGLLRKRRFDAHVAWQNYAILALIFATTLFFVARFLSLRHEIGLAEYRIEQMKPELAETNAKYLRARIDSLTYVIDGYVSAQSVLDSLLVGSDRWSRTMERTASQAAAVPGIWIETWREQAGVLRISGNATDRNQVVRLAARLEADIETVAFSSIRDWPVYTFAMTMKVPTDLPDAVRYLRDRVASAPPIPVAAVLPQGASAGVTSQPSATPEKTTNPASD